MPYIKHFDNWNKVKKKIDKNFKVPYFVEREIWWCNAGVNVGFEEDGKGDNFNRPFLVITKFNNDLFLGIPLTTKIKDNKYYIKIDIDKQVVCAMISQVKSISTKRLYNKIGRLDKRDFYNVKKSLVKEVVRFKD